jgi:hypothetical protein
MPTCEKGGVARVEEDEVAGAQAFAVDWATATGDVGRTTAHLDAGGAAVDVGHHAAAVETGIGVLAAEAIIGIDQAQRVDHHVVGFRAAGWPFDRLLRLPLGRRRRAAAGRQQQRDQAGDEADVYAWRIV